MPHLQTQNVEELSEKIHKLYCVQFEKDHGKPYWTEGDYSKLDERTKEYDRNIARFILERDTALVEMMNGKRRTAPKNVLDAETKEERDNYFYNLALSDVLSHLQDIK